MEKDISLLPKLLQWPGLGQIETRSQEPHLFSTEVAGVQTLPLLFPEHQRRAGSQVGQPGPE